MKVTRKWHCVLLHVCGFEQNRCVFIPGLYRGKLVYKQVRERLPCSRGNSLLGKLPTSQRPETPALTHRYRGNGETHEQVVVSVSWGGLESGRGEYSLHPQCRSDHLKHGARSTFFCSVVVWRRRRGREEEIWSRLVLHRVFQNNQRTRFVRNVCWFWKCLYAYLQNFLTESGQAPLLNAILNPWRSPAYSHSTLAIMSLRQYNYVIVVFSFHLLIYSTN